MRRLRLAAGCLGLALLTGACGGSSTSPSGGHLTVSTITPNTGTTFGGTTVTITGAGFSAAATVKIGGVTATNVAVTGDTTLSATTGVHASGATDVVVSDAGRTATLGRGFTYVSPGSAPNSPPTILSVSARGSRPNEPDRFADLGEPINLSAAVQDAETPSNQLSYEWSSSAGGTFTGTGAAVQWQVPLAVATPLTITLTVTVVERYNDADANGLPVPKENRVSSTVDVSVHDSNKEVGDMSRQFLLDFSDSGIKDVNFIMRNFTFTGSCARTAKDESDQVGNNRVLWRINKYLVGPASVSVNFKGVCSFVHGPLAGDACSSTPVQWDSTYLPDGTPNSVAGNDQITAMYIQAENRWRLCSSDFDGHQSFTPLIHGHAFIR